MAMRLAGQIAGAEKSKARRFRGGPPWTILSAWVRVVNMLFLIDQAG